jgi:tripartite-type tricarboxylate transporter receptor subunit TctC
VAGIIRFPDVVDVNLSVPVHTIPELISYAKANPGKLNFASSGIGSTLHVAGELFKMMAGVDIVHVPYRGGGPALVDLMSGRVQLMFDNLPTSTGIHSSRQATALGGDHGSAFAGGAGFAHGCRFRAGL